MTSDGFWVLFGFSSIYHLFLGNLHQFFLLLLFSISKRTSNCRMLLPHSSSVCVVMKPPSPSHHPLRPHCPVCIQWISSPLGFEKPPSDGLQMAFISHRQRSIGWWRLLTDTPWKRVVTQLLEEDWRHPVAVNTTRCKYTGKYTGQITVTTLWVPLFTQHLIHRQNYQSHLHIKSSSTGNPRNNQIFSGALSQTAWQEAKR